MASKFYAIEEVNYEAEVEKVLKGLGFERNDFNRPTLEFSGGLDGKGFYFNNPNAARSCGCGESFAV